MTREQRAGSAIGPLRAAVYCRVSSAGQEDNASLPTQLAACRRHAIEHGWAVVQEEQEVHSGADLHGRHGLGRIRDGIRAGRVDVLVCYALDRLSRRQVHLAIVADECERIGARLAFVTEEFEQSAVGEFIRAAKAFAAEVEREKLIERTTRGKRARVDGGRLIPGRKAPYGYRWDDPIGKARLVEDPLEADTVRRIFHEAAGGKALRRIAADLAASGHPSPSGRAHWARTTLHAILNHPVYVGDARAYRMQRSRGRDGHLQAKWRPDDEQVVLPADVAPPLVERDLRTAALERMGRNKAEAPRRNRDAEATLLRAGFARCGVCGNALRAVYRRDGRWDYICGNRDKGFEHRRPSISATLLDCAVWSKVEDVLTRPEVIATEVDRRRASDPHAAALVTLDRRVVDVEARRVRLARAVAVLDDPEASGPLLAELRALADQAKALDLERRDVAALASSWEADRELLGGLAAWTARVRGNLPQLDYQERRSILSALGVEVTVQPAPAEPRWELVLRWGGPEERTVSATR